MTIRADFHIHSCLSPCGSLDMSPTRIVAEAKAKGLNLIAISDHNTTLNCPALAALCADDPEIHCFFGVEATTNEEVHVLCLFDRLEKSMAFGEVIYDHLASMPNDPERFGDQVYVDELENIIGEVEKSLGAGNALDLSFDALKHMVAEMGGLFIPAHVTRPAYSLYSQLGFVPDEYFAALEVTASYFNDGNTYPELDKFPLIGDSDAHYPDGIGRICNEFEVECELKNITLDVLKSVFAEKKITIKMG